MIQENELDIKREEVTEDFTLDNFTKNNYGLPICAKRILENGVTFDQRIACFRLSVNLKGLGFPIDVTTGALMGWRLKNKPKNDKRTITPDEIIEQTKWAY